MANYRKIYKDYYGIDFSSDYDIHHIDMDRGNNEIENLLLLPKDLHRRYHFYLRNAQPSGNGMVSFDAKVSGNAVNGRSYARGAIRNLLEVIDECAVWYDYKLYLDGLIPNIHNIKLECDK